ncbi:sialidase-3-like [Acanthopagrus latus]|uniref:sialidase-3-like n=1 Tax=Acanthopagrus latus TaxID=8177 RepID=UPI00187BEB05|nr:sialidase-3-like [Acanthopagrus latus]
MGNKPSHPKIQEERTVFLSKDNEVYRIPSLFYDRDKKIFIAFAEQRSTADDAHAKHLVMKTGMLKKEESTGVRAIEWSELKVVKEAHLDGHRPMNPCPVYEKTSKTLFLFFICVQGIVAECWQRFWGCNRARLCYITTKDGGQTWSSVTDLTHLPDINEWATFAVGPGHGLQTESGRLIIPTYAYASCSASYCCISCYCAIPYGLALYSDDKGSSWEFGEMLETKSVECEMVEVSDDAGHNYIYCNARSEGGYRVEAIDDGAGFKTLPSAGKLVETGKGCQGSVVSFPALSEGATTDSSPNKWLLYTHPSDQSNRINLGVYLNKTPQDPNGWSKPWIINSGPSGYSDLAYIGDGWFACLMECGVQKYTEQIAYEVFHYSHVKKGIEE